MRSKLVADSYRYCAARKRYLKMKLFLQILGLAIIDYIIIWFWIKMISPDSSSYIALIYLIPLVIAINLVIATVLYFAKSTHVNLFLINSLISAVLMYFIFVNRVDLNHKKWKENSLMEWTFKVDETTYEIRYLKNEKSFNISERTDIHSLVSIIDGRVESSDHGEILCLISDSTRYQIKSGYLFGFDSRGSIELKPQ